MKAHLGGTVSGTTYTGGHVAHTGQLHTGQFYFDESVTSQITVLDPYSVDTTTRMPNQDDRIFVSGGGSGLLTLCPLHGPRSSVRHGVLGSIVVGVDPTATPAAI